MKKYNRKDTSGKFAKTKEPKNQMMRLTLEEKTFIIKRRMNEGKSYDRTFILDDIDKPVEKKIQECYLCRSKDHKDAILTIGFSCFDAFLKQAVGKTP